MNKGLWNASLFFGLAGLILFLAGYLRSVYDIRRRRRKGKAKARVVALIPRENEISPQMGYRNLYYPVFEFYAGGKLYKIEYPSGSYPSRFRINQTVPILYDTEDPEDLIIDTEGIRYQIPQFLYAAGIALLLLSALLFARFALRG